MAVLNDLNYQFKFVRIGWDPGDGEIRARISLPLAENDGLPTDQLLGMLSLATTISERAMPRLREALDKSPVEASTGAPGTGGEAARAPESPTLPLTSTSSSSAKTPVGQTDGTGAVIGNSCVVWVLAVGVLLIGLAALLAVLFYFVF